MTRTPIVDAHLDMATNVLGGRDYGASAADVQAKEKRSSQRCMVTLRELEAGGVAVAFATLFTGTNTYDADGNGVYREPPEESALRQLDVYLGWEAEGKARVIRNRADLKAHLDAWENDGKLGVVVLIEGGDSITSPDDLPAWYERGVRLIGPAWSQTRYCGGTRRPGGLTAAGRDLVSGMRELGIVLDVSHMAEQSFWDAMDAGPGRVIASHSNARALIQGGPLMGGDRHLSDDMIKKLGSLDAVIGLNLFNGFLTGEWEAALIGRLVVRVFGRVPGPTANFVTLDVLRAHAEHIAGLIGWDRVGIGSDMDGGLGVDETPLGIDTAADLERVGDLVPLEAHAGVLGGNWLRFLSEALPE